MFKVGDIVYCEGCTTPVPLARRKSTGEIEIVKFQKGVKVGVKVSYQGDSSVRLTCPKCGMGHIFMHIEESIALN